ncbi:hypothetical protein TKK_0009699 [Trichogramma kaykai]
MPREKSSLRKKSLKKSQRADEWQQQQRESLVDPRSVSNGKIVGPRPARRRQGRADDYARRWIVAEGPRAGRILASSVGLVALLALLAGDVAQRYGDQEGNGDAHADARPDNRLIDAAVGSTCRQIFTSDYYPAPD